MAVESIDSLQAEPRIVMAETKTATTTRLYAVDKLRVALTILVVAHHAAQAYGPTGGAWPIFSLERSALLGPFFAVNAMFFMGLFFLVSGYFVPQSLDRKGAASFLKGRFTRLGIPVLFFALVVFGPGAYFSQAELPSFTAFVRHLYRTGWQDLYAHLWFLIHLLLYSIGYVVWRQFVRRDRPSPQMEIPLPSHRTILGAIVVLALVTWIVRIWYPIDRWAPLLFVVPAEIAHLPQYVSMFALGILAYRGDWLRRLPIATGMIWLAIGLAAAGAYYVYDLVGVRYIPSIADTGGLNWRSLVYSLWEALVCLGLGMGLLTLFREWFSGKPGKLMAIVVGAAYGAYIIHLLVVIGVQAGLAGVTLPPFTKFVLVTLVGAIISFGLAHLAKQLPGLRKIL